MGNPSLPALGTQEQHRSAGQRNQNWVKAVEAEISVALQAM